MKNRNWYYCQAVLVLSLGLQPFQAGVSAEALAVWEDESLSEEPLVFENAELPTGQETVWDCVYFGAYPSAEVVKTDWDAVDAYAVQEGDVIRDDSLYEALR